MHKHACTMQQGSAGTRQVSVHHGREHHGKGEGAGGRENGAWGPNYQYKITTHWQGRWGGGGEGWGEYGKARGVWPGSLGRTKRTTLEGPVSPGTPSPHTHTEAGILPREWGGGGGWGKGCCGKKSTKEKGNQPHTPGGRWWQEYTYRVVGRSVCRWHAPVVVGGTVWESLLGHGGGNGSKPSSVNKGLCVGWSGVRALQNSQHGREGNTGRNNNQPTKCRHGGGVV